MWCGLLPVVPHFMCACYVDQLLSACVYVMLWVVHQLLAGVYVMLFSSCWQVCMSCCSAVTNRCVLYSVAADRCGLCCVDHPLLKNMCHVVQEC